MKPIGSEFKSPAVKMTKAKFINAVLLYLGANQQFYENNIDVTKRFAEIDIFCTRKLIRNTQKS